MTMSAGPRAGVRPGGHCRFDLSVAIGRRPADVYAFLADVQDAEPVPRRAAVRMVKDPPGPTRVGTVWHEAVRFAPGLWLHVDSVVTEVQPPHRLGMDARSLWFTAHLTYEIAPTEDGSVLRQREELVPRRLLRPFRRAIEQRLRPRLRQRLDDIKNVLEEQQEPTAR
ncbi:SRPBCC family protein [Geodermatophilus sp. SYSU D00684]